MNSNQSSRRFVLRSQLQVDASPGLKQALKQIAATENTTLKEVVLRALSSKYPHLEAYVRSELKEGML